MVGKPRVCNFYIFFFDQQLLKALPVLQQQIDALLEVDVCHLCSVLNFGVQIGRVLGTRFVADLQNWIRSDLENLQEATISIKMNRLYIGC